LQKIEKLIFVKTGIHARLATFFTEMVNYPLGNKNTTTARHPQSAFPPEGAARLNRGPMANCVFCLPKLVTADMFGLSHNVLLLAVQFCVHSMLAPIPAPLFQL
jgi:hypothetical protein